MIDAGSSFSILMFTSAVCLVVLMIFLCKLVISVTKLSENANVIATSIQQEIEPTLKELKEAAKSINSIANSADERFQSTKASFASLIGLTSCVSGKIKSFSQGILKGISFGMNLFNKK